MKLNSVNYFRGWNVSFGQQTQRSDCTATTAADEDRRPLQEADL